MDDTYLVLMIRDSKTGFLEKEINAYKITSNEELLLNMYAEELDAIYVHIKLSCDREVLNWEYDAIYDYYDENIFGDNIISITEVEGSYNPTWEIVFKYIENDNDMELLISKLLSIHKNELYDVYEAIKGKEDEYK